METIQRIGDTRHGAIESEGHRSSLEIIIDRLRYADALDTGLEKLERGRQRAVAPNANQRAEA
jgi:hypothetical protein